MSECLSRILFPLDINSFLEHYQARTYFHVGRNSARYYDYLLSTRDIDTFLRSEQLPAAFFNVVKEGTKVPLEEWSRFDSSERGASLVAVPNKLFDLYSEGATVILNAADRSLPSLNNLCRTLTLDLGFPTQTNVYITPRGAAGFSKHVDNHEVLIIQIDGSKRWLLDPQEAPTEVILQPGDLLYVPRGLAHAARAQECDSIHVTLGLKPAYGFQLIEDLAALAGKGAGFQQPVPPRFAGEEVKRAFETGFLQQLQSLILRTTTSQLLEHRLNSWVENQARGWPGHFSDIRRFRDMTTKTIVRRRPEVLSVLKNEGKFLSVEFAGKRILVPGFLKDALERIMESEAFAIGEIEGFMTDPGRVKLVSEFVKGGLLRIVRI